MKKDLINPSNREVIQLHEFTDTLNLIGIGFEIAGFVIILPHLKRWLRRKLHRSLQEVEKESEGAPLGIEESDEIVSNVVNRYRKKIENIGIPLVITGLFFQGLSTLFHS